MLVKENFIDVDFDNIPLDPYWNVGNEKECKMHRIHAYPAKFPAFITSKAIEFANNHQVDVHVIADIFCGCGTVAYESTRNKKQFWGCDINPVATLIAETKSQIYDDILLERYQEQIIHEFTTSTVDENELETINDRIKYWFKPTQIKDLFLLKKVINSCFCNDLKYLRFFLCAFSNILKSTSVWLTKSIKPQVDPQKQPADVLSTFCRQVHMMRAANRESLIEETPAVNIETINFLNKEINEPFVDLVITSPPYVTSYEYADLHQLSSLWLDYTNDYKLLRKGTIGSLYHGSDYNEDLQQLNISGKYIVEELFKVDRNKARAAAKYFVDMQKTITKTYKLLNRNGIALFVIGNTEYKSVKINNAKHLVESMLAANFVSIDVNRRKISKKILTPYRDKKGKFTTDQNSRKVYSEEFIIIGKKNGYN